MIDIKNEVSLIGGITADPELVNDNKILKFSIAVDFGGSDDSNPDNKTGYFDVTYYLDTEDNPRNAKWVRDRLNAGDLSKGSQIHLKGRLFHRRFVHNDQKQSRVQVVAYALTYYGTKRDDSADRPAKTTTASNTMPSEF